MDPVWMLFSRRTFSRLAYWLSALGFDLRDRSFTNRIYFVYFCAFWLVWATAVFTLLGSMVADLFTALQIYSSPPQIIVTFTIYTIIIWSLVKFGQVTRRSPFVFSEEDAYLLCQTPVSRSKVGLLWFIRGMLGSILPFAAGIVIVTFALVEWRLQGEVTYLFISRYLASSLRALVLVIPIQIGLQGAVWGFGAVRLSRRSNPLWLRLVFLAAVFLFAAGFLTPGLQRLFTAPLTLSLQLAFFEDRSTTARLSGLGLSFTYLAAGLVFLWVQSRHINLSRAAQETAHLATAGAARSYGQYDLAKTIALRRRLGTANPENRFLARPGGSLYLRKVVVQTMRTYRLRDLLQLLLVFGLSWGMLTPSSWPVKMVLAGIWTIHVGGITTRRFRSDLACWWLVRSLPISPWDLIKSELTLFWAVCVFVSWLGLAFSRAAVLYISTAAVLLPFMAANAALAAVEDILRHSRARVLMSSSLGEENVPQQNVRGIILGLISALIPFGILMGSSGNLWQPVWGIVAVPTAVLFAYFIRRSVLAAYRWIE